MGVSLSVHVIGIVFWIGGLLFITRFLKGLSEAPHAPTAALIKRSFWGFVIPGVVLSLASGLYQLTVKGFAYYFKESHWFHGKATLLIVLLVITGLVAGAVDSAANGKVPPAKRSGMYHGIVSGCFVIIVFVTLLSTR